MHFKLALITGASSGLGEELCKQLAFKKIPLLLTGRDTKKLKSLSDTLKPFTQVEFFAADLLDPIQRKQLIALIPIKTPDLIINCAGFGIYGPVLATSTEKQIEVFTLNAIIPIEITIESARMLKANNSSGIIFNISSVASFFTFPFMAAYASAKSCLTHFSKSFDFEMKPNGIRIYVSSPGQIDTAFIQRAGGKKDYPRTWSMSKKFAAKRILKQLEKNKSLQIIDYRYKLIVFLTRLIPKSLLCKRLAWEIKQRLPKNIF